MGNITDADRVYDMIYYKDSLGFILAFEHWRAELIGNQHRLRRCQITVPLCIL